MRHLNFSAAQHSKKVSPEQADDNGQDQFGDNQVETSSRQEQQCLTEPRLTAASDASQGQSEAALGQMPTAPLFVAQSPAGKGQADEWVKKYLAMHPECGQDEALKGTV